MKRLLIAMAMATLLSSCTMGYIASGSDVQMSGRVNISLQPSWGPAGYDYARYYYFPDFNFYYDVNRALFHYQNRGVWVAAATLPIGGIYPSDLHIYYKVVINKAKPWLKNHRHISLYKKYRGNHSQRILRDVRNYSPTHHTTPNRIPPRIENRGSHTSPPARNNNTSQYGSGQGSRRNENSVTTPPSNKRNNKSGSSSSITNGRSNSSSGNSGRQSSTSSRGSNRSNDKSTRSSSSSSAAGSRSNGSRGR